MVINGMIPINQLHHGASLNACCDGMRGVDAMIATTKNAMVDTVNEISVASGAEPTSWRMRELAAVCSGVQNPMTSAMSV